MKLSGNRCKTTTQNLIKLWNSLPHDMLDVCIHKVVNMEKRSNLRGAIQLWDLVTYTPVFAYCALTCLRRKKQTHRKPLTSVHPGMILFNLSLITSFHLQIERGSCGQEGCSFFLPEGCLKPNPLSEQP